MDQAENIWREAENAVQCRGSGAYAYLFEQAEIAKSLGDVESAVSYWDIALAIVEVMNAIENRVCLEPD